MKTRLMDITYRPIIYGSLMRTLCTLLFTITGNVLQLRQAHQNVLSHTEFIGRSQNTVPIASTQVAIKGTVQYSTGADGSQESEQT